METVFSLKVSELNNDLIKVIKSLFKNDREVKITVNSSNIPESNKPETKEEYFAQIDKAIENIEKGKGITFTWEEFNNLAKKLENA